MFIHTRAGGVTCLRLSFAKSAVKIDGLFLFLPSKPLFCIVVVLLGSYSLQGRNVTVTYHVSSENRHTIFNGAVLKR